MVVSVSLILQRWCVTSEPGLPRRVQLYLFSDKAFGFAKFPALIEETLTGSAYKTNITHRSRRNVFTGHVVDQLKTISLRAF